MHIKSAHFITSAVKPEQYPGADLPEIAFAGRSNVGKSSLINTLVNRKRLVKTSGTPGRTQLINFFVINDELSLVDLPGYGYAKVPVSVKKNWGPMVETYLTKRDNLKVVVLLIDIRRDVRIEEMNFIDWLEHYKIPIIPVLTKSDKLSKTNQMKQRKLITADLGIGAENVVLFSAKSRQGKDTLWNKISEKCGLIQKDD
ncbi:MAG: YihA family ribosome biogenesis GTP-binding protein [Desulfobacteraceae bacterium]|nr:YihA family ribosome biogenesis GTP-binding protein [Desulfobacteraceae bacterium]